MLAYISANHQIQQSLAAHCHSVASLCSRYTEELGLGTLGFLIGLLHDAGKARTLFQEYLLGKGQASSEKINHSAFGAKMVHELSISNPSPYHPLLNQLLALAVCSHHNGLPDCLTPDGQDEYEKHLFPGPQQDYKECMDHFLNECISFDDLSILYAKSLDELSDFWEYLRPAGHFGIGMLQKFLTSCLIAADRYDTYCFEAEKVPRRPRHPQWHTKCIQLEKYFSAAFHTKNLLNRLRNKISEGCRDFSSCPTGIYYLPVPCGGGKTLASLRFALNHCNKYEKQHLYYVVPSYSVVDQISTQIRDALGLSAQDPFLTEHQYNVIQDNFSDRDALQEAELFTQCWTGPIIITTMTQILETLFGKGLSRFHQLANSVIIFDEIQSIPPNCIRLFHNAIDFLARICNTTVILCTPTQPLLFKTTLSDFPIPSYEQLVPDFSLKFRQLKRVKIIDSTTPSGYTCEELTDDILEKMQQHDKILVILNTKQAVQTVYEFLKGRIEVPVFLLSSNLCQMHRGSVLEQLHHAPQDKKLVCISTPLIEAGIDLSFDCVFRSLSSMDHIAQAAGRCNRDGEWGRFLPVYLITLDKRLEDLSRLRDIEKGQALLRHILSEFPPGAKEVDLLSPKMMQRYYAYYYNAYKDQMDYPISREDKPLFQTSFTLCELLGKNQKAITAYYHQTARLPSFVFFQSFHTATECFHTSRGDAVSVLVPYKQGAGMIAELQTDLDFNQKQMLLQKCVPYLVEVFPAELKALLASEAVYWLDAPGIYILREGYYTEALGICLKDKQPFLAY